MWYPAMGIKTKHNKKGIEDAVLELQEHPMPPMPKSDEEDVFEHVRHAAQFDVRHESFSD